MKEEDILARQSRPQQYSTWEPKTRDWRYATGVFQHDDFEDDPKHRSAWDTMDYDYHISINNVKSRRSVVSRSSSGIGSELEADNAPITTRTTWASMTKFSSRSRQASDEEDSVPGIDSLTVRLRFTGNNIAELQSIVDNEKVSPQTPQDVSRTPSLGTPQSLRVLRSSLTPTTTRRAPKLKRPSFPDAVRSRYTLPAPFQRSWVDETQDFNMKAIHSTLQLPNEKLEDLGPKYHWYADAVPIHAIFPPGVPLSAKEIIAYYPHHVRWKGVIIRLTNNQYRGQDILGMQAFFRGPPTHNLTPAQLNTFQRDTVKSSIPHSNKSTRQADRNLHTIHLALGKSVENQCSKGFTLPTFTDLLHGLQHLPSGLDARGLTESLAWYMSVRDTFTPPLELNVLHTQSLIRALRQPLRGFGPQNLDRGALREWRDRGEGFEERRVRGGEVGGGGVKKSTTAASGHIELGRVEDGQENKGMGRERSQMHMNLDNDSVALHLTLPIRHFLTFPFLALHGVVAEALKVGIEKAELRLAERKAEQVKRDMEAKWAAARLEVDKDGNDGKWEKGRDETVECEEKTRTYRIPKRGRPVVEEDGDREEDQQPSPKKLKTAASDSVQQPIPIRPRAHRQQHAVARVYGRRDYD